MIQAVIFDLDNTLYDTSILAFNARLNAVKAMVEAGLKTTVEDGLERLLEIVGTEGPNFNNHFDKLIESFGMNESPHIVAAGVVAYHETKKAYLVPFPDTVPTLLKLREMGVKIGVVSNGKPVKQWEKLIRLGLQHFFDTVIIREKDGKPHPQPLFDAASDLGVEIEKCIMVGDKLEYDILCAKNACMPAVQIISSKNIDDKNSTIEPDYLISSLKGILDIIELSKE